ERLEQGFHRVSMRYERASFDRRFEVTPFVGFDEGAKSAASGQRGYGARTSEVVVGLRAQQALRFNPHTELTLGIDALGRGSDLRREGTLTLPAREGDPYAFGVLPAAEWASDAYRTHLVDAALYAELAWSVGRLSLLPGLRVSTQLVETSALWPP